MAQILTAEPQPPSRHRPDLDPQLESICLKAMAKQNTDRYPSMQELADVATEIAKKVFTGYGDSYAKDCAMK